MKIYLFFCDSQMTMSMSSYGYIHIYSPFERLGLTTFFKGNR